MRYLKYTLLLMVLAVGQSAVRAQHVYFPQQGKIHYEKTIFIKNLLKRYANYAPEAQSRGVFNQFVEGAPETVVYKKTLSFNNDEVLFEHVKEEPSDDIRQLSMMGVFESGVNTYQNLKSGEMSSAFALAGQDVLIQDSLVRTKWKITNEYRTIAGYNCRRANGLVMDSIYVVAFYTDEIPVSAGPSTFNGLPGVILGMAIPELHYNIFATKVDLTPVPFINRNVGARRAKPMRREQVYSQLNAIVGSFLGEKSFNLVLAGYFL